MKKLSLLFVSSFLLLFCSVSTPGLFVKARLEVYPEQEEWQGGKFANKTGEIVRFRIPSTGYVSVPVPPNRGTSGLIKVLPGLLYVEVDRLLPGGTWEPRWTTIRLDVDNQRGDIPPCYGRVLPFDWIGWAKKRTY